MFGNVQQNFDSEATRFSARLDTLNELDKRLNEVVEEISKNYGSDIPSREMEVINRFSIKIMELRNEINRKYESHLLREINEL